MMNVRELLENPKASKVLLASSLAEIGIGVTLDTGLLLVSHGWEGLSCIQFWAYGLPFTWRALSGCSSFSWRLDGFTFLLDTVFYMAVGYVLVVAYQRNRREWTTKALIPFLVGVVYIILVMAWFGLLSWWNTH